jgi:hypothetical protein
VLHARRYDAAEEARDFFRARVRRDVEVAHRPAQDVVPHGAAHEEAALARLGEDGREIEHLARGAYLPHTPRRYNGGEDGRKP